jgi:hypothetical protein
VLDVLLASSVRQDQARVQIVGPDTIQTVPWPVLHVLQEPSLPVLVLQASMIALNVGPGLMLLGEHLAVLRVMLEGTPSRLDLAAVLPV